jgi:hypothetical protein
MTIDLTKSSYEHIYYFGKAAGWDDGKEITLTGNAQEVSHFLFAYMETRNQRAQYASSRPS